MQEQKIEDSVRVRFAVREDCKQIIELIRELADYEHCPDHVHIDEATLQRDGFDGSPPLFRCLVAEEAGGDGGRLVGLALFYNTYSTWEGLCVFLEDLYVTQQFRGRRIGRRLIARVAKYAVHAGAARLGFNVLAWNQPSKGFYRHLGAVNLTEHQQWEVFRVDGDSLNQLAQTSVD